MTNASHSHFKYVLGRLVIAWALFPMLLIEPGITVAKITPETAVSGQTAVFDGTHPRVRAVMAVQDRHTPALMAIPGVVGTATGLAEDGQPVIQVFTESSVGVGTIPDRLDGVPVQVKVTGVFFAMPGPPPGKGPGNGGGGKIDPTVRFVRPVPIGVSTGNANECSAGTIGARVTDGAHVYALSNNHVYARENSAVAGEEVLQPGLYDANCFYDSNNVIGYLAAYVPIVFSTSASNQVDAAVASTTTALVDNATPADGYGLPQSATVSASLGQPVQKYGRTSSLTNGVIEYIHATINVGYGTGTARFTDQIVVTAGKPFIKPGDSGSLLVTDPGKKPLGLLFAGNSSGKMAIANPIDLVLGGFDLDGDGAIDPLFIDGQ